MTPKEELIIKFNHIILIQGFDKFSMVGLAKAANISRAKLYIYFKNKDEIVEAVVGRHLLFTQKYPVPTKITIDNLLPTILNALVLVGSTTDLFENELKQKYPQLYRDFIRSYSDYFRDLKVYYQAAQKQHLITDKVSVDYLLFQNKINVRGILQSVQSGEITLEQGEQYLKEGFTFQMHSMLVNHPEPSAEVTKFEKILLAEYYDTYSQVEN